ncbi:c-type cytochrome [Nisaea sp.]|uniref:c-type cytochrome n=1 Tax=Nisaea sp. TaxID=2024842 RepID=UPI002B274C96|nr:c-type cytochrome [Nisaea sp.]
MSVWTARIIKAVSLAVMLAVSPASGPVAASEIGDAKTGARLFQVCKACHRVGKEARNAVGPHLNGVFGRVAGSVEAFRYSEGLIRAGADGLIWTADSLDAYLENPKSLVSRTRMNFIGMPSAEDRSHVIAYLRDFSDKPSDIPEAEPTSTATDHALDPAILAIVGDPDYGEYLSGECLTCHQAGGLDEGIPAITGWPREDFVVAMHAYKKEIRAHPVMRMMAGRLSDEEIAGLAAYFEGLE